MDRDHQFAPAYDIYLCKTGAQVPCDDRTERRVRSTADLARAMDFCGVRSGRDTDKFSRLSLTREPADTVSAPMIAESPVNIECKVTEVKRFPSHDMFIAEITAVHVDDRYVDDDGAYDYAAMDLVSFSHGKYYRLKKEELGFFGYSIMKPKTARKRKARRKK